MSSPTVQDEANAASAVEVTAKSLVQKQSERQKRRRTQAGGRGSSARTSLWSTIAVTLKSSDTQHKFVCAVCRFEGSMNSNLSTSNIILHYKTKHAALHTALVNLNDSNAPESMLLNRINQERENTARRNRRHGIERFFRTQDRVHGRTEHCDVVVPPKTLQAVAVIMFSCTTESSASQISSPILQGFVDVFGGRLQFTSSDVTERTLFDTYAAICRILRSSVTNARTGCITVDGWSAALGTPILGMTWHYIDSEWNMHCVPVATLNMGMASKTGQQLRCIIQEILEQNPIVGSDDVRVHTATSDNEAATALAVDLLTNYVGSVRCVVHTLALAVNDVFETGTVWKKYLDHVNKVTTYFNHHQKAAQLLAQKQVEEGITRDRLQRLKHDIPMRWHSRLAAMSVYLCRLHNISAVAQELNIDSDDLPTLSEDQQDVLAEFITVLAEVRRVARQLEADRKVTMSRAPRLLRELHETLLIMGGDMLTAGSAAQAADNTGLFDEDSDNLLEVVALPTHPSTASADKSRDEARSIRLKKNHPKALAIRLADRINARLGAIWKCADVAAVNWAPSSEDDSQPEREMHEPRRVLLFHIAAMLDVNECSLDFLSCAADEKEAYLKSLYGAVIREAVELNPALDAHANGLEVVFDLFHQEMRGELSNNGRRDPSAALMYWKDANATRTMISPVPFNTVARAALSSQASSAPAERLFSDLGRREGNQSQSLLTSTLEMTEMIRVYVCNALNNKIGLQHGLMHPRGRAFRQLVDTVASEIVKHEAST